MIISKTNMPSIADSDIQVYKILTLEDKSVFFGQQYSIGENIPESDGEMRYDDKVKLYFIDKGWLSSLATEDDAIKYRDKVLPNSWKTKIVQMTIPSGTEYFKGMLGDYCSKKLIWKE